VQEEREEQPRIRGRAEGRAEGTREGSGRKADAERDEQKETVRARERPGRRRRGRDGCTSTRSSSPIVARLETELKGALEVKAKAMRAAKTTVRPRLRALQTMSFGEGIYKIGLTRTPRPVRARRGTGEVGAVLLRVF